MASAAEAASLRGELQVAQQEQQAAEQAAQRLRATEEQLAQLRSSHRQMQVAHSQQGARLSSSQQRLKDVLAGQEGLAAAAAAARQEAEHLRGEAAEARQQLQVAEREAATFRGRFQAVQAANDSLRLQILATGGIVSGTAAGIVSSKKGPPPMEVPPLPSPRFAAGGAGPAQSPGCRITAAAAVAADCKVGLAFRTSSLDSEIGATIPAARTSPHSPRHTGGRVGGHRSPPHFAGC